MSSPRRTRAAAAAAPPLEAGVAPTEQHETSGPATPEATAPEAPTTAQDAPGPEPTQLPVAVAPKGVTAALTGAQMADVSTRAKAVDELRTKANTARDEAILADRAATWAQEALSASIARLIDEADLDPGLIYRVDLERGEIVPARTRG